VVSRAFVVRVVPYGEADVVITLFTEALGKVAAMARGARKSRRRFVAALEPMHTVQVTIDELPGAELFGLREAVVVVPRTHILGDLDRMNAAGKALRWARGMQPYAGSGVWLGSKRSSDVSMIRPTRSPGTHLAASGLRMLRHFGYGPTRRLRALRAPVIRRAPRTSTPDQGLICQSCGGGQSPHHHWSTPPRGRLSAAAVGRDAALLAGDTAVAQKLVDEALAGHAGLEE
jgi:DNA repair protein RecO (recombination protein O)